MQIKVRHLKNVQFEVEARSHRILCDQPAENKGDDTGLTPPEFLLASLGTCAAYYAVEYLRARGLDEHSVEVTVDAEKLKPPARLGNFRILVRTPLALSPEQQEGLNRSVHHCLVHNTLLNPPSISIEIELGQPEQA
jgi:putative redox protein